MRCAIYPFTVLMDIEITAKKDINITGASVMEAPDALRECAELL
jgi:hypothetical protein